jgi:hypothetical protein
MSIKMNPLQVTSIQLESIKKEFDCYINPAIKHEVIFDTTSIEEYKLNEFFNTQEFSNISVPEGMILFYFA